MTPMKRFLSSAWFPFVTCLILAAGATAAFALLKPGADIDNGELSHAMTIAGWATGGATALVSWILIGILNLIRRIVRARRVSILHPVVVLIGVFPWVVFAWIMLDEPPYTMFARAAMEFVARPLLWGSLLATLFTLVMSIPVLIPSKKK